MAMTGRERVLRALSHETTDRVPKDLGGMLSTGISCFAYPALRASLGLRPSPPRVYDTMQMLAVVESDVLDALGCDVVPVFGHEASGAFDEPRRWRRYDFGGRLPARVRRPGDFHVDASGTISRKGGSSMPPNSHVFNVEHAGQHLDMDGDIPMEDLRALKRNLEKQLSNRRQFAEIGAYCAKVRAATSRAVMYSGFQPGLGFRGGMAAFSIHCLTNPDYVHELHNILVDAAEKYYERLIPAIAPSVDVIMAIADDQGTQNSTILPPRVFSELFKPYYRRVNDAIHRLAPEMKTFLHCCGAIYEIVDDIVESGFDALNPIQWTAGGRSPREWKEKCRGRIAMWGGGCDSQGILPLGSVEDVRRHVAEVVPILADCSGYVFCNIHNLLAEIPPAKIKAMYEAAD